MNEKVYKILTLEEWDNAKETGEITTNLDQQDGFIHLSTSNQLAGTLAFYFNGETFLLFLLLGQALQILIPLQVQQIQIPTRLSYQSH